jgi:hypothetical protein
MLMTNGTMKVTKWNNEVVEGTDQQGQSFTATPAHDARGDVFFEFHEESWYAKEFKTILNRPIRSMLDLSTGHVSKETIQFLQEQTEAMIPDIIVYAKGEHGYFIPVIPDDRSDLSDDLIRLLNYAEACSCTWIMLDSD